jgi:hypothetical protein
MVFGCAAVYCAIFATGFWLYGQTAYASALTLIAAISVLLLFNIGGKTGAESD